MGKYIKINEKIFRAVKQLTEGGATIQECADYFMVSHATVSRIRSAQTYEEYRHMVQIACLENKKRNTQKKEEKPEIKDEKQPGGTLSANYQMNRLYEQMKAQTELLKLISEKMAFIVEQLA